VAVLSRSFAGTLQRRFPSLSNDGLTLILGIVFVFGVFQQLAMPKFDATLLILMGISNGTYLGFKLPTAQKES
jgi:hypothetical protein